MEELIQRFNGTMTSTAERRMREQLGNDDGALFSANPAKNRYNNIIPYSHSQPADCGYFNGNVVDFSIRGVALRFLITQAPVDLHDFYTVIWGFRPTSVVQVTKFVDQCILKAERYIPLAPEQEDVQILQNAVIGSRFTAALRAQLAGASQAEIDRCVNMDCNAMPWHSHELRIKDFLVETEKYEKISSFYRYRIAVQRSAESPFGFTYFYYPNWTDFAAPDSFHEVYALCKQIQGQTDILVHCSAGVGRSATFCVCYVVFELFRRGVIGKDAPQACAWQALASDVLEVIEHFRTKRHPQCVQTPEQFRFILEFCNYCAGLQ